MDGAALRVGGGCPVLYKAVDRPRNLCYTETMEVKRVGRPPKPRGKVRSVVYPMRFTPREWREIQARARKGGKSVAELLREAVGL